MTAQHLHLVLNHLPIFGLLAALIPLGVGAFKKSRELVLVGLLMAVIFGATTPIVFFAGENAEDAVEAVLDPSSKSWLETHEERAETVAPIVYVTTALCLVGFVGVHKRPRWLRPVSVTGAVLVGLSIALLGWVGQAGGRIRHPELRPAHSAATNAPPHTPTRDDDD